MYKHFDDVIILLLIINIINNNISFIHSKKLTTDNVDNNNKQNNNKNSNMNYKFNYTIANPTAKTPNSMPFQGEYFELLGPEVTTRYSEVFWHTQPIQLPEDIINRFDNKVMAVTGYEVDIVRTSKKDNKIVTTSAASYEIYNHHYSGWMYGKGASPSSYEQSGSDDNPIVGSSIDEEIPMMHGMPLPRWEIKQNGTDAIDYPNVQGFSEGNGNEHRGSYKGYAKGYAQVIKSPRIWANNPMIINTNKKLTNEKGTASSPGHISRLLPKHSLAPKDATYSGILECPCTDRKIKILDGYKITLNPCGSKSIEVATRNECLHAANNIGLTPLYNATSIEEKNSPNGCAVTYDENKSGWVVSFHITASSTANDGDDDDVDTVEINKCSPGNSSQNVVGSAKVMFNEKSNISSSITVSIDISDSDVTLILTGPKHSWFGIALNATIMADTPYAIIVENEKVEERHLGNHAQGTKLKQQSITLLENTVIGNLRTVKMKVPLKGIDSNHFTFNKNMKTLPILMAHGISSTFAYHGTTRASLMLTLSKANSFQCICRDPNANSGTIDGIVFNAKVCAPFPTSELLTTHNAICNISEYNGGLYCCHDGSILLDKDQIVPEKTDTWRLKYRFYFEEYKEQRNLFRVWWSTEATNNEYDVPKSTSDCLNIKTPGKECIHEIRSKFQGRDILSGLHGGGGSQCMVSGDDAACGNITLIQERDGGKFQLMYAAAHCHTPACMSLELWNDDTNELICRNAPIYGTGNEAQNEESYVIAIPPCVWGSKEEGLNPPPILSLDSNLTTIKRANNTNGHWGVMALWQMRAAYVGGNPPSWNRKV